MRRSTSIRRSSRSRCSTPITAASHRWSATCSPVPAGAGTVHVIRLILGGAFDRFPKLQLVIGHLGEGLMSLFPRLDNMTPVMTKLQRPITAYLRENVHYAVSGFNFPTTFLNLLLEVGTPRIMFSADHPYQAMTLARAFLEHLPVPAADRERIAHGNAEKLFGV